MHTVRLLLNTTEYDKAVIEKRFYAISHIHNVLVKHARKLIRKLDADKDYQKALEEYKTLLKKSELSKEEKSYKKVLSDKMQAERNEIGLTEYSLQAYIKVCAARYKKLLSSQQVQKEATRVYHGVEKVLFSEGRDIHFKKNFKFNTICGKTNTNGIKFNKENLLIDWMGLSIKCKLPGNVSSRDYILEALNDDISYCEIERKMFPNGWHYYVIVYLKGDAPKKLISIGSNTSGIDIGPSTIACVSDEAVTLKELAPKCDIYNKKIENSLRHMDISRRKSNPLKYNVDGTINKGNHDKWVYSKTYLKNQMKLKTLYRQKAAYIKQSHEEMINVLFKDSKYFIIEEMNFKGLQKRSKNTERSDKTSFIKQKDGTVKTVHKYKKKKRFGKSLNNRAPSSFVTILERKAALYGGAVSKVNTKAFKASQYNHQTDEYEKHSLSERFKYINDCKVQRDLYSAFLLKNSNETFDKPDRGKCIYEFENYLKMQNDLITEMKINNITMKQCFGF